VTVAGRRRRPPARSTPCSTAWAPTSSSAPDAPTEPVTVTPLSLVPGTGPDPAAPVAEPAPVASSAAVDPDAESSAWSPTVTPPPVDPENDRALMRLGVLGAAVGAVALVTVLRQLRRHRR
jgi:hypothetical protein